MQFIKEHMNCCICGIPNPDPHHAKTGGKGIKCEDLLCVPLCRKHHSLCHSEGKVSFQQKHNINFLEEREKCLRAYIKFKEPMED